MANNAPSSSKLSTGLNILSAGLDGFMRGMGINSHLNMGYNSGMFGNNNPRTASPSETKDESPLDRVYVDNVGREDTSTYRDAVRVVKDSERLAATDQVEAIRRLDTGVIKLATYVQGEFGKVRTSLKDHAVNINKLSDQNLQLQRRQRALDDQIKFLSSQQRNGIGGKDPFELDNLKKRLAALEAQSPGGGGGGPGLGDIPWWRRTPPAGAAKAPVKTPSAKPGVRGPWGTMGRLATAGIMGATIAAPLALLQTGDELAIDTTSKITKEAVAKYGKATVMAARRKYKPWYLGPVGESYYDPDRTNNSNDMEWCAQLLVSQAIPPSASRGPSWQRQGEPSAQNMDRRSFDKWLQQSQGGVAPGYGFSNSLGSRQGNPFTSGAGMPSAGGFGGNRTFGPMNATGGRSSGGSSGGGGGARAGSGGSRPLNEGSTPWDYSMNQASTTFNGKVIEGGDPRLASLRSSFAQELADKPDLKRQLVASIDAEDPRGAQVYIQEVMNRAASRGDTLEKTLNLQRFRDKGGYYPRETIAQVEKRKYSAEGLMKYDKELNYVLGGGHHSVDGVDTSHVTGNASGGVGVGELIYTNPRTNERYGLETPDAHWPNKIRNTRVNASGAVPSGLGQTHPNPAAPYPSGQGVGALMQRLQGPPARSGPAGGLGATAQRGDVEGRPDLRGKNMSDLFKAGTQRLYHQGGQVQGVDASVMRLIKDASKDLPEGYRVEMISGKDGRSRTGTTNHPNGLAMDTIIYDANNKEVPHDRGGPGMAHYERLYQSVNERGKILYPGKEYIWGGTWVSKAAGNGDPMHIQLRANVHGSSQGSGAYNPDRGAHGHQFEPYLMSDKERTDYKNMIKNRAAEEYRNPTATATTTPATPSATTGAPPAAPSATAQRPLFMTGPNGPPPGYVPPTPSATTGAPPAASTATPVPPSTSRVVKHGVTPAMVDWVRTKEDFQDQAFPDYGTTNWGYGTSAKGTGKISEMDARKEMVHELDKHVQEINKLNPNLDAGSRQALASLSFNTGGNWYKMGDTNTDGSPTLKGLVKKGDMEGMKQKFTQYVKAGGTPLQGLINRRQQELKFFGQANPLAPDKLETWTTSKIPGGPTSQQQIQSILGKDGSGVTPIPGAGVAASIEPAKAATGGTPAGSAISGKAIVYNPEMETTRIPGAGVATPVEKPIAPTPGIGTRRTGRPDMRNFPDATDVTQAKTESASLVTEHIPGKAPTEGEGGQPEEGGEKPAEGGSKPTEGGGGTTPAKGGGGGDDNGGYGRVNTQGAGGSTDFGSSPGSDGYGNEKESPDNNGGICAI